MTDLTQLHKALSEAKSGSRELDGLLAVLDGWEWHGDGKPEEHHFMAGHWVKPGARGSGTFDDGLCACREIAEEWGNSSPAPAYTTSLDAITSLIERKMAGKTGTVHTADGSPTPYTHRVCLVGPHEDGWWEGAIERTTVEYNLDYWDIGRGWSKGSALALAIALVSALIAQEGEK